MPAISGCCSKISQRWATVVLAFMLFSNIYAMRSGLSIAITEMTLPPNSTKVFSEDSCPARNDDGRNNNTSMKLTERSSRSRYDWSERTQGLILSSFYWGHVLSALCGGMISQKFGSKHTLSFALLTMSTLTLLTPRCTTWGGSTGLIFLRLAMGLAEGPIQSAAANLLARWIPRDERSRAGYVIQSSVPLGTIFGTLPSGLILDSFDGDWSILFYFYGAAGLATLLLHIAFCYNGPSDSPYISANELTYLKNTIDHTHSKLPFAPWRYILKSLPVWAAIVVSAGHGYGLLTNLSDMSKYMSSVLKFSVKNNGYLTSVPYVSMAVAGCLICWAIDRAFARKLISVSAARKIGCSIASIGCGVFLVAASYAGCNATLVVVLLSVSSGCLSAFLSSSSINAIDLSPNFASTISGLMHAVATAVGMLAPYVVGLLTPNQTLNEWRLAFWIVFGILLATDAFYLIFASAEVQEWNDPAFLNAKVPANDGKLVEESVDLLKVPQ